MRRLIGDDADRPPVEPREADEDVRAKCWCTSRKSPRRRRVMTSSMSYGWFGDSRHESIERLVLAVGGRRRRRGGSSRLLPA
jgi:hypothetical protein